MTKESLLVALDLLGKRTDGAGIWPTFWLRGGHKVKGAFELVEEKTRPHLLTVVVTTPSVPETITVFRPEAVVGITVDPME